MKKSKYFLLTAALVIFVSCSKDDGPDVNSTLILGEWNFEEYTYSGTSTTIMDGRTYSSVYSGEAFDLDARINFHDATNYSAEGSYIIKLTNTSYGQTVVQNYPITDLNLTGEYRIEGNKIFTTSNAPAGGALIDPTEPSEGTIVELTANRLVIVARQEINSTVQGAQIEIVYEMYQVYSR